MDIEGVLAIILIFGGGACIAIAFSPNGRAVADRIRGKSPPSAWTSPSGCSRRTARASGSDRANERGREDLMGELEVLIPIVALGGFFGSVIAFILSRTYLAKLKAQSQAGGVTGQGDVLAAVEELRREVAELAERVDFTERLLAKRGDGEAGKLGPGERRTAST